MQLSLAGCIYFPIYQYYKHPEKDLYDIYYWKRPYVILKNVIWNVKLILVPATFCIKNSFDLLIRLFSASYIYRFVLYSFCGLFCERFGTILMIIWGYYVGFGLVPFGVIFVNPVAPNKNVVLYLIDFFTKGCFNFLYTCCGKKLK